MTPTDRYRALLERLDRWFSAASAANPGVVPCKSGCSACCHGPFDISVADAALLADGLRKLDPGTLEEARRRAERLLARAKKLEPRWQPPYDVAALNGDGDDAEESRFDALCDALHDEPCPLLDDAGRCRVYADRPLVCRLIGLPVRAGRGRTIENACPIQHQFPRYAALAPQPFDLAPFEEDEFACLGEAARALFGEGGPLSRFSTPGDARDGALDRDYETFIAALVTLLAAPPA